MLRGAASNRAGRLLWSTVTGLAILLGVATLSDALLLAWAFTALLLIGVLTVAYLIIPRPAAFLRGALLILAPVTLIISGALVGPRLIDTAREKVTRQWSEGAQGSDRIARWVHGVDAFLVSPIVGFGPGGYSGPFEPFHGEEVHNSLLDWLTITGVIGLAALALWGAWIMQLGMRRHPVVMLGLALTLFLFAQFHFVLRQPIVWVMLLTVAFAAPPTRAARANAT
jgi:O-antigen ligase